MLDARSLTPDANKRQASNVKPNHLEREKMQIADNIHMFLGGGGSVLESHCYLILGKKTVLVDTGIDADLLIANMKNLGIKPAAVDLIVNTHCHFDHIRSNKSIKEKTNAKIAVHKMDAPHISESISDFNRGEFHKEILEVAKADILLDEGDLINDFEVIHTPGHTAGSICLFEKKSGILISGDTVFAEGSCGRTDLPGGSAGEMRNTLKKLSKLKIEKIFPGHGVPVLQNAKENIKLALSSLS